VKPSPHLPFAYLPANLTGQSAQLPTSCALSAPAAGRIQLKNRDQELLPRFGQLFSLPLDFWKTAKPRPFFVAQFVKELLAKGETIYSIAPSLTSQYRCRVSRAPLSSLLQPFASIFAYISVSELRGTKLVAIPRSFLDAAP
jgi:hypothetical protein